MILQATILLAGLSVTAGQGGSLCCPIPQFHAFQHVTIVNSTSSMRSLQSFIYDGDNQRYVISGDLNYDYIGTTKVIYDYNKRTGYRINTETRVCTTFPLRGNFKEQENVCVPNGAVSSGPLYYGYGQGRLASLSYSPTTVGGRHQAVVATVTKEGCFPIISTTTTTGGQGGNTLKVLGYAYIYPGNPDVTVFDIPSYCTM
ncbi:ependymin-related protein 1-like [Haliotis cracherodii]|uniref:ependymin-related protein 1-like n=1 Tax=Haliotis cracherodii TaxID=6455 RepID=UPI0039E7A03F